MASVMAGPCCLVWAAGLRPPNRLKKGCGQFILSQPRHKLPGSGSDLLFAPSFDLGVDAGAVRRSGRDVPADVTKQILADLESKELQDQIGIVGMLPQGEENAKEGVVIWPVNETHVAEVSVYAAGFSGEMRTVVTKDPKTGKAASTTVRKTLMLRFQGHGDLKNVGSTPLPMVEQRWIMR